jgi:hypothetical protein
MARRDWTPEEIKKLPTEELINEMKELLAQVMVRSAELSRRTNASEQSEGKPTRNLL